MSDEQIQALADNYGIRFYRHPDGSVTNLPASSVAVFCPGRVWETPTDHGIGDQARPVGEV
jgi:hypothetical protein